MGKGTGFGKTILFGDHFVVYGIPGIAAALSAHTDAEVKKGVKGLEFIDHRPETPEYKEKKKDEIQRQLGAIVKHFNLDLEKDPLTITLSGNLVCASGVGASAALAASIARAIDQEYNLGMDAEKINEAAYIAEEAGSGTPSGIDNTCAVYGGFITFEKNLAGGKNNIGVIEVGKPVEIVLASSGVTQETKEVVADVRTLKEKNPEWFERVVKEYNATYEAGLDAIKSGDWIKVGEMMNKNHRLLQEITVSSDLMDKMQKIALDAGALGSKVTGTGRGGSLISLTPGKELQDKVAATLEEAGFKTTKTEIGATEESMGANK